jgi:hypothetical protein
MSDNTGPMIGRVDRAARTILEARRTGVARAEQTERVRRIGVLLHLAAGDPESMTRITAFVAGARAVGLDRRPGCSFAARRGVSPINVRADGESERAVAEFARDSSDGLIVVVSSIATIQRDLLVKLAARHRLPAVYPYRFFVDAGGLSGIGKAADQAWTRYSFLNCTAMCSSAGFHSSCWLRTNACASVGVAGCT